MAPVYMLDEKGVWYQSHKSWWWPWARWVKQFDGIDPFTGRTRTGAGTISFVYFIND